MRHGIWHASRGDSNDHSAQGVDRVRDVVVKMVHGPVEPNVRSRRARLYARRPKRLFGSEPKHDMKLTEGNAPTNAPIVSGAFFHRVGSIVLLGSDTIASTSFFSSMHSVPLYFAWPTTCPLLSIV